LVVTEPIYLAHSEAQISRLNFVVSRREKMMRAAIFQNPTAESVLEPLFFFSYCCLPSRGRTSATTPVSAANNHFIYRQDTKFLVEINISTKINSEIL
jgi:hypothetical protein